MQVMFLRIERPGSPAKQLEYVHAWCTTLQARTDEAAKMSCRDLNVAAVRTAIQALLAPAG